MKEIYSHSTALQWFYRLNKSSLRLESNSWNAQSLIKFKKINKIKYRNSFLIELSGSMPPSRTLTVLRIIQPFINSICTEKDYVNDFACNDTVKKQ